MKKLPSSAASRLQYQFPWRIFSSIALFQALAVLIAFGAAAIAARFFFERQFIAQVEDQLLGTLSAVAVDLPDPVPDAWCRRHSGQDDYRITIIGADGAVVCDSHHDTQAMDNHLSRPEVADAATAGRGVSVRFSETLKEAMLYAALRPEGRTEILRGAITLARVEATKAVFDRSLLLVLGGLAAFLAACSLWAARRLVFPLGRMLVKAQAALEDPAASARLDEAPGEATFGEWSELESSIERMRADLESKAESLSTERAEYQTMMSAISDAIVAVDESCATRFFNAPFALLFPATRSRPKMHLSELFREPDILDAFRAALARGEPAVVNATPVGVDGGKRFLSVSVAPLRRGDGKVYGAVGVFHDVTELKKAEQIRIDFVANVSHEIKTPLTSIRGYTETMQSDLEVGRAVPPAFIEKIGRNVDRLMNLINDLLDLSSLESTRKVQKTALSTATVTGRLVKQMEPVFEAKQQTLEVVVAARVVEADGARLEQVLTNLLDNAHKYSPRGAKITVRWEEAEDGAVLLKVVDDGPGIAAEHHDRLFERFYRVDRGRSREMGGTGLGLAIVKHIMMQHDGSVGVISRAGEGATFVCRFPRTAPSV